MITTQVHNERVCNNALTYKIMCNFNNQLKSEGAVFTSKLFGEHHNNEDIHRMDFT